jgi:predicted PurR-regulated permease PerM
MTPGRPPAATVTLIERAVVLLMIALLLLGVFQVLRPFTTAILFGTIVAVAAWPLREGLVRGGMGRGWAAFLLLMLSLAVIALPALILAPGLADQVAHGSNRLTHFLETVPHNAPDWVAGLPLVGSQIAGVWNDLVSGEVGLRAALAPYSDGLRRALVAAATGLADSLLQLALALGVATMFWVHGRELAAALRDVLRRLGGEAAAHTLDTIGASVRSVAYGVVGTSALDAVLMGSGLWVAGIHGAATYGFISLILAMSQIGLPLMYAIGLVSTWFLFHVGAWGWASFMLVWCGVISAVDHVLRPLRGRDAALAGHPRRVRRLRLVRLPRPVHRARVAGGCLHAAHNLAQPAGVTAKRPVSGRRCG